MISALAKPVVVKMIIVKTKNIIESFCILNLLLFNFTTFALLGIGLLLLALVLVGCTTVQPVQGNTVLATDDFEVLGRVTKECPLGEAGFTVLFEEAKHNIVGFLSPFIKRDCIRAEAVLKRFFAFSFWF